MKDIDLGRYGRRKIQSKKKTHTEKDKQTDRRMRGDSTHGQRKENSKCKQTDTHGKKKGTQTVRETDKQTSILL